ncbi:MAG TPA: hypothetical protein VMY59_08855 [Candidatus Thermoplasmatota archaeon]|nr:hypothetical protein [Candidatus Thermoplasmatota archaeon]
MTKYYQGMATSSNGKKVRVVYLPKKNKANSMFAWTVLGKRRKWFKTKQNAIKYAKR